MQTLHPIRVVAKRTGLSPHVIRAWEKRYGALSPRRTGTNHRLYSDEDLERLELLARARLVGRSISRIARLSTAALRRLVEQDRSVGTSREGPAEARVALEKCLDAARGLDAQLLLNTLEQASARLARPRLLEDVIVPLMYALGSEWRDGKLRLAHEHLATAVVRTFVGGLNNDGFQTPASAPLVVVATPAGQLHEIGALIAAATASTEGWRTIYLGPDVLAVDIAAAFSANRARAVALSILYPLDDRALDDELHLLAELLPRETCIIAGGRAVLGYREVLEEIGAVQPSDYESFRRVLEGLRRSATFRASTLP